MMKKRRIVNKLYIAIDNNIQTDNETDTSKNVIINNISNQSVQSVKTVINVIERNANNNAYALIVIIIIYGSNI